MNLTPHSWYRGYRLFLAGVLAVAFTGYFVGLQQSRHSSQVGAPLPQERHPSAAPSNVPTAPRYRDVGDAFASHRWKSKIGDLPVEKDPPPPAKPATDAEVEKSLALRRTLRAFDGAPPAMPHPGSGSDSSCLLCHVDGKRIGERYARRMSHPFYAACTTCHVETRAAASKDSVTSFEGLLPVSRGERAYPGAPPAIPHAMWMRTDCLSCHGAAGPTALQTTHPERLGCVQCHAPTSPLDFLPLVLEKTP